MPRADVLFPEFFASIGLTNAEMYGSQERADRALRPLATPDPRPLPTGEELKARGQKQAADAEVVWSQRAVEWIRFRASGSFFCADDLCDAVGRPRHPNAVGAVLTACCRSKRIERHVYARSTRPARRGGLICIWRVL